MLAARWKQLIDAGQVQDSGQTQAQLLKRGKPSRDARIDKSAPSFLAHGKLPRIDSVLPGAQPDGIERVAWRSLDRQWCVADARVIDMPRPVLWSVRGDSQIFFTSGLEETSSGPGLIANTAVPDLNAFNNRGGIVFPFYRDAGGTNPNVTPGLLDLLAGTFGKPVTAST